MCFYISWTGALHAIEESALFLSISAYSYKFFVTDIVYMCRYKNNYIMGNNIFCHSIHFCVLLLNVQSEIRARACVPFTGCINNFIRSPTTRAHKTERVRYGKIRILKNFSRPVYRPSTYYCATRFIDVYLKISIRTPRRRRPHARPIKRAEPVFIFAAPYRPWGETRPRLKAYEGGRYIFIFVNLQAEVEVWYMCYYNFH